MILVTLLFCYIFSFNFIKVLGDVKSDKGSLVFVFDTTGSMHDDLKQLKDSAESILNTALEQRDAINSFVLVPFNDPAVGPATVTTSKEEFKDALNKINIRGGGDCPEMSLTGIELALNVSLPQSYVYVLTDATASDHRIVGRILDLVQRKQSQIVFLLTGHCHDVDKPNYKVYKQIAATSSGQVFNMNKTSVYKVLDFVKSSLRGRTVNLGSAVNLSGYNHSQAIPIDRSVGEVTVSVSGTRPQIRVYNPEGIEVNGPPKLETTLDLAEIMVVKVNQPVPGNWSIRVGSEEDYSYKVVGISNLTFKHGFSVQKPEGFDETSFRPLQGTKNYMLVSLTDIKTRVHIENAQILSLNGSLLFEVPLQNIDGTKQMYIADAFRPPDDFFYIAIHGYDENGDGLKRVGTTAVLPNFPDVPYLTVPSLVKAHKHEKVVLECRIESMVPVSGAWSQLSRRLQPQVNSLQSTIVRYTIEDLTEQTAGSYRCTAKNTAGFSKAFTEVDILVDPPEVIISPRNMTVFYGDVVNITCEVKTESTLNNIILTLNGTKIRDYTNDCTNTPDEDFHYKNIHSFVASFESAGTYTCLAENKGGKSSNSANIRLERTPKVQIIGAKEIKALAGAKVILECSAENANIFQWLDPNNNVVQQEVKDANKSKLELENLDPKDEGIWTCLVQRDDFRALDTVSVKVTMTPRVSINGPKTVTVMYGSSYDLICQVIAKPKPKVILWRYDNQQDFTDEEITSGKNNKYQSKFHLKDVTAKNSGNYTCYAENEEGNSRSSVLVNVRKNMNILKGFGDNQVDLYSQIELNCIIDSVPKPSINWYFNETALIQSNKVHFNIDNTSLFITKVDLDNIGIFRCEAENAYEKKLVHGVLRVNGLGKPLLSKDPVKCVVVRGASLNITCRVIKGLPKPDILWYYRRNTSTGYKKVVSNSKITVNEDNKITITNVSDFDSGYFKCDATNYYGNDVYETFVEVQYPPRLIDGQTEDTIELKIASNVTIPCEATGLPRPNLQWTNNNKTFKNQNILVAKDGTLSISNAKVSDSGIYTCTADNVWGTVRKNVILFIFDPPKVKSTIDKELQVLEEETVQLTCLVTGHPEPEVVWYHGRVALKNKTDRMSVRGDYSLSFVANVTDFGNYTCEALNKYGKDSITYSLFVWVPPSITNEFSIKKEVLKGSNMTLPCDAIGFPLPTLKWYYEQDNLVQYSKELIIDGASSLLLTNVSSIDQGTYCCAVENVAGKDQKCTRILVHEYPHILSENFTGPLIGTDLDTSLVIPCRVEGRPKPSVLWKKDNLIVKSDSNFNTAIDGSLIMNNPKVNHTGIYECEATNKYGSDRRTYEVQIYSFPDRMKKEDTDITITVLEGDSETIQCPVKNIEYYNVKWYKNANLISTTKSLELVNITRNDSSIYACVATNKISSIHFIIRIHVEWKPRFLDKAATEIDVIKRDDYYLNCKSDCEPACEVRWTFNSDQLLNHNSSVFKLLNVQINQAGTYECFVENKHEKIHRSFTLKVLEPPFISYFDVLDIEISEGGSYSLNCVARGTPEPEVRWKYNNSDWILINNSLTLAKASLDSEGLFLCEATNKAGKARLMYEVSMVSRPKIVDVVVYDEENELSVDDAVEIKPNAKIRISCQASGRPTPLIQWITSTGNVISNKSNLDQTYVELVLDSSSIEAGYTCVASNKMGEAERKINVIKLVSPKILTTPFEATDLINPTTAKLVIISGHPFTLHCHPEGRPSPVLHWFKDTMPLSLNDDKMQFRNGDEEVVTNNALIQQSGNYTCLARNKIGESSYSYLVTVIEPPHITKERYSIKARENKKITFLCPITGTPVPRVYWKKNNYEVITQNTTEVLLLNGNSTLMLNQVKLSDAGTYTCIQTNLAGSSETTFKLQVLVPPSIREDVETKQLKLSGSTVLVCDAGGIPAPKYIWYKDSIHLSSSNIEIIFNTSLLSLWRVDAKNAGQYTCVADNEVGTDKKIFNIVIEVPAKWSRWSSWGYCNVTCGLGYQTRNRTCQYTYGSVTIDSTAVTSQYLVLDKTACSGGNSDPRECRMPSCEEDDTKAVWSPWSPWSPCSSNCGDSTQMRMRRCLLESKTCPGDNVELRKCDSLPPCPEQTDESEDSREPVTEPDVTELDGSEPDFYSPEVTYEFVPEVFDPQHPKEFTGIDSMPDLDVTKPSKKYHEVVVTDNLDQSVKGPCRNGLRYNRVDEECEDIDECLVENNVCHSTQICENTVGGYRCYCEDGFVSLGAGQRCLDVNECEQNTHRCEFACVNTAGSYVCACPLHLRLHIDKHHCVKPFDYKKPLPKGRNKK